MKLVSYVANYFEAARRGAQGDGALALPCRHGQWSKHDSGLTVSSLPSVRSRELSPSVAVHGGDGLSIMLMLRTISTRKGTEF
jgi:hypothetical protein